MYGKRSSQRIKHVFNFKTCGFKLKKMYDCRDITLHSIAAENELYKETLLIYKNVFILLNFGL